MSEERVITRALLSVTNKSQLPELAAGLVGHGVELISTGGTASAIRKAGLPVREASDVTGFPEMLDGRLKTIHPKIAGGILAERHKVEHMEALREHGIPVIDLLVVNLYEFEKYASQPGVTFQKVIENIDIGGPTMIRAAAKNYTDVAVVTSPDQYQLILNELANNEGCLHVETRSWLAHVAFQLTGNYDTAIFEYLSLRDHKGELLA